MSRERSRPGTTADARNRRIIAARVLARTDKLLGAELSKLIRLKPGAHYGSTFISSSDRVRALRAATTLVDAATSRTLAPGT